MKITFITPGYSPKPVGGHKIIYEYANQLAARGHEVTVVYPLRWDWRSETIRLVKNRPLSLTRLRLWLNQKYNQHPNLIGTTEVPWYHFDKRVKMLRVPEAQPSYFPDGDAIFWYGEDCPPEKGKQFGLLQSYGVFSKALEDALFLAPVPKIVISRWLYEQGLKLGVSPDELIYIPNGIDHSKYRIVTPIEKRPQRIAMLYSPAPLKGAKEGIRALELARDRFPALQAVLFGVFPRPRRLPSWIEYHHDPPQEELVRNIYNGSGIYVCASWTEGFCLPNAEAMACGCALVSTDIGGVRDYAEHEVTALLSPAKNSGALAENIIRLLVDDGLRIRLAQAGHARIQEFNWERSTDLLERFLRERIGLSRV